MTIKFHRIFWFLLLFPLMATAQSDFTQLNWNELRIDSVLPVYSEVVPLETDYRLFDYQVRVRYPEWGALTAKEAAVIGRYDQQIADSLMIDAAVGISRGVGMLDISFVPIIRREGQYAKLLSGKVEIIPVPKARPQRAKRVGGTAQQRWAAHSVLANGRWVKISVTSNGIHHLTHQQLLDMGFTSPANCRVYGYGGHLQPEVIDADLDFDDLEEVSLWPVADGYLFYANGLDTYRDGKHVVNHYAREACYFVTEASTAVGAFPTADATPVVTTGGSNTIDAYTSIDPQEYAFFQGGRQLFSGTDLSSGTQRYLLPMPCRPIAAEAKLTVNVVAAHDAQTKVSTTFNGEEMDDITINALADYIYAVHGERTFNVTPQEANVVNLAASSTKGYQARLNYITLAYRGQLTLDGTYHSIPFTFSSSVSGGEVLSINYANGQQPQLWQLAERGTPTTALQGTTTTDNGKTYYRVQVGADGAEHRYVALDVADYGVYPQPTIVGEIGNQDLHSLKDVDMVIITPVSGIFDAEAERLAEAHRKLEGLEVAVVNAGHIYNEFSSGTPDATAYRRLMKMLYDRAADGDGRAPRYLLLFGDCAWDNRMVTSYWTKTDPNDFLLCYESVNSVSDVSCFVMEDYFGLLDDGEGANVTREKTDLGVGRFTVRTQAEAKSVVDKTIAYLAGDNAGAWKNIVCFLGDDGDNNQHLRYADEVAQIVENNYPQLEVRKVMWDAYKREVTASGNRYPDVYKAINKQMKEGALMMNYTGHGATYCLSHELVLQIADFAGYNSPRVPLWVTAACDVMPFDTQKDNIGETALLNPNGAAVAFYGTSRTVYAHKNLELNRYFTKALFATDEQGRPNRVGDAVRLSKAQLAGNEIGSAENKLHYALLGDPALTFGSVSNKIVLDRINGTSTSELPADFTIHAGGKMKLEGHVESQSGTTATDFNGVLSVHFYDSRSTITCLNNARVEDGAFTFSAYDKMLYNGQDSVRSGLFELTCPVPIDIHYSNEAGRLIFFAEQNDHRSEACGYSQDFLLGGTEGTFEDADGPRITAYLNDENFTEGQAVNRSPYLIASFKDENGVNTAGNGIGHDIELVVDDDPLSTYVLNDYYVNEFGDYTRGHLAFSIPTLSAGQHKLTLRAWDVLNNPGSTSLSFEVDPELKPSILKLTATRNPALTQTQFLLTYDRPGADCSFTIEVFDFTGRLVWSHTGTANNDSGYHTVSWNLTNGMGSPLNSGVYLYRVRLSCDESEETTQAQKLIINRKQ